ncbi:histidinol-phosphatase HisJ [Paenisporosarcina sp. TG20]|uniref:histidinol-phosphatase HisJ n=1 Tax=Paenisporosarcina sp. TG20 TaxID=1211706 RepID=UPI0002FE7692|nr:histidinol-phosphatase HisJ [Paenisporosarcina sp. TG20]
MKRDAHIHSPYCPHGTKDSFELYIEKAIQNGFTDISFTEHAPAPHGFIDSVPTQDSFLNRNSLEPYIFELQKLKKMYAKDITIKIGLEFDFIEGYEKEITQLLNDIGPTLDDSILSVHFLLNEKSYTCIDFSSHVFLDFAEQLGSIENVYSLYYKTVQNSISAELGAFKPKRIGHPSLIHKFRYAHDTLVDDHEMIVKTLQLMKEYNYELDVNSAGLAKQYCLEPYPPQAYITLAKEMGIPLVFGSDAHRAEDLHQYYKQVYNNS